MSLALPLPRFLSSSRAFVAANQGRGRGRGLKPQGDLRPSPTYIPKTHLYDENTATLPCKLVMSMRSENVEKHLVLWVDPVKGHLLCFYKESENQSSDWRGQVGGIVKLCGRWPPPFLQCLQEPTPKGTHPFSPHSPSVSAKTRTNSPQINSHFFSYFMFKGSSVTTVLK